MRRARWWRYGQSGCGWWRCRSDSGDGDLVAAGVVGAKAFGRGGISSGSVILLVFVPLTKEVFGAGSV